MEDLAERKYNEMDETDRIIVRLLYEVYKLSIAAACLGELFGISDIASKDTDHRISDAAIASMLGIHKKSGRIKTMFTYVTTYKPRVETIIKKIEEAYPERRVIDFKEEVSEEARKKFFLDDLTSPRFFFEDDLNKMIYMCIIIFNSVEAILKGEKS